MRWPAAHLRHSVHSPSRFCAGGVNGYNPANAPQRTKHQEGYGMNLLPKHDILRRLAELIELKHRNVSASHLSLIHI